MSRPSVIQSRRIDALCGEFEASWRSGRRPRIETLAADANAADRSRLLAELVALEFALRREAGESVSVAEYLRRFPQDEATVAAALKVLERPDTREQAPSPEGEDAAAGAGSTAEPSQAATPDAPRYDLQRQLGEGGMGVVFRARDRQLDRDLAVKVLAEHLQAREEAEQRFLREARICAQLQHPGIIPIHELGRLDNRPYFAMKLVEGKSLAELLQARSSPDQDQPRLLEIFERVCETVAYAHSRHVVHRDLKPANIMLGSFGEVYVIDWGLAKQMPAEDGAEPQGDGDPMDSRQDQVGGPRGEAVAQVGPTACNGQAVDGSRAGESLAWTFLGDVVGTPSYMAPEQACGDIGAIDRRSDVFALGAVLCEILTGAPLYPRGDRATRLERAQRGDLGETLARLDECEADPELRSLTRACLAVERSERPADAGEVLRRLNAYLRGVREKLRRVELEQVEAQARAEERRRRRRVVLGLAASLLVLVVSIAAASAWTAQREAVRQRDAVTRRERIHVQLAETLDEVDALYADAPADWRQDPARRTRVRELAHRAEALVDNPGVESTLVQRVAALRDRITAEDADGRLLDRLEAIHLKLAEVNPKTNKFASGRLRPYYRYAFDGYGLNLDQVPAERAVERIRGRPPHVAEACVYALESWRLLFKRPVPQRQWIDAVLNGIDSNPWRREVRDAYHQKDWDAVGDLLHSVSQERPTVDAIHVVAEQLMEAGQFDLALRLLEAAQPIYPGDFWINLYLGLAYYSHPQPRYEESVRFVTAALAIREADSAYWLLGMALKELQRYPEAEQAFRGALRLQPQYVQAQLQLAEVLAAEEKWSEAADAFRRVLALDPDHAEARQRLQTCQEKSAE